MKTEPNFGILLAIGELLFENKAFFLGKTLEIDGFYASGKLLIPLGRYIILILLKDTYLNLRNWYYIENV